MRLIDNYTTASRETHEKDKKVILSEDTYAICEALEKLADAIRSAHG